MKERFSDKLLVEGNDDQHVICALCKKYNLPETFDVVDCGGIDKLKQVLPIRLKASGANTIGIIIDADTDLQARWDSIKTLLVSANFTPPNEFPEDGLVVTNTSSNQKVGVWLMPNNCLNGMLEDFVSFLIPADDQLLPIINTTMTDIETKKLNKYADIHKSKALIHTWLAWQEVPGTPMGQSITKRYLNTTEETCVKLIAWLNCLFT